MAVESANGVQSQKQAPYCKREPLLHLDRGRVARYWHATRRDPSLR